jgi:hypothetical protein
VAPATWLICLCLLIVEPREPSGSSSWALWQWAVPLLIWGLAIVVLWWDPFRAVWFFID